MEYVSEGDQSVLFSAQDKEILKILQELQDNADNTDLKFPDVLEFDNKTMKRYFCSV